MGLMQQLQQTSQFSSLSAILAMAKGNPQSLMSQLMISDQNFARFYEENKNKTPEQAFRDNGFDYSQFKGILR